MLGTPSLTAKGSALTGPDGEVADASGHVWRTQDLHATTIVVVTFTMLFTAVLALLRWAAQKGWRSWRADKVIQ